MRTIGSITLVLALCLAGPAAAKKRPIELDEGFFTWDKFSYSEWTDARKAQLTGSSIVNRYGGMYVEHDDVVLTYDGDSTLTTEASLRLVAAAEAVPERFYVARIDPSAGETLEVERIRLQRKGKPDLSYTLDDLFEEGADSWFGYFDSDRLYYIKLPQDEADVTLDVDIRVVTRSEPGFEGFVQDAVMLQSGGLCQERSITVRYPRERPLYLETRGFDVKFKKKRDGDLEVVNLTLHQLLPVANERWSAHGLVNYPALLVSSLPD